MKKETGNIAIMLTQKNRELAETAKKKKESLDQKDKNIQELQTNLKKVESEMDKKEKTSKDLNGQLKKDNRAKDQKIRELEERLEEIKKTVVKEETRKRYMAKPNENQVLEGQLKTQKTEIENLQSQLAVKKYLKGKKMVLMLNIVWFGCLQL